MVMPHSNSHHHRSRASARIRLCTRYVASRLFGSCPPTCSYEYVQRVLIVLKEQVAACYTACPINRLSAATGQHGIFVAFLL